MRRRRKEQSQGSRGKRWPGVAAAVLAPLTIYLVCRSTALALSAPAAAALPPADHSAALKSVARAARNPKHKVAVSELNTARTASVSMPLAHEPFFVAAKAQEDRGRLDRAILLMQEAKRRRPNNVPIRSKLLVYYGSARNYAGFLSELDYLLRRSEIAKERVFPELVKGISDPAWRVALADMLARKPVWREQFLNAAGAGRVEPEHAAALVESIREQTRGGDLGAEKRFYIQTLVSAGRYGAARAVWLETVGAKQAENALVFDPGFRGSRASPPFDWSLKELDVGRATMARSAEGPHLEVEYFGGRDAVLAEQLLALAPGSYRLRFRARSEATSMSGRLRWSVSCLPNNNEIVSVEPRRLVPSYAAFEGRFSVPAGCGGQSLRLVAEAGDYSSPMTASISGLEVRRGD